MRESGAVVVERDGMCLQRVGKENVAITVWERTIKLGDAVVLRLAICGVPKGARGTVRHIDMPGNGRTSDVLLVDFGVGSGALHSIRVKPEELEGGKEEVGA